MRFWHVARLMVVLLTSGAAAASSDDSQASDLITDLLSQLPTCAVPCLVEAYANSTCPIDDIACRCNSATLASQAEACVLKSCTLVEALSTKNATATACHAPIRDKSGEYLAVSVALGVLSIACVMTRLIFKRFFSASRALGIDDKVLCGVLALRITCTIISARGLVPNGIGKDVWTLPPHELTSFVMFLYVIEVLYLAEVPLIKLVFSLFFLRLFPGPVIQRLIWATVVFNVLFGVASCLAGIFQCTPVSYFWTQYVERSAGHCVNINAFGWTNASISLAIDLWMLAIPISQIRQLQLHWTKRIGAYIMFLLGSFVTVVSILRLHSLVSWANSTNPTYDEFEIVYWSTIEVNVGVLCVCLPTFRLILTRVFPRLSSNTTAPTGSTLSQNQHRLSSYYSSADPAVAMTRPSEYKRMSASEHSVSEQ